ncbi:MAG: putative Na+/H+ antiporter [Thermodesulfobacteriota bacterium]
MGEILIHRIKQVPFNLAATIIFILAIVHTFLTSKFLYYAHKWKEEHLEKVKKGDEPENSTHIVSELFHFFGEVEVVFGMWAIALGGAVIFFYDWKTFSNYIDGINFTEPMFVVVIMTLASSRPILQLSEQIMDKIAAIFKGTLAAWWLTILTLGPILGSFITEPAAMTISALLLASKFYELKPSDKFKYATMGLLLVNISVGGTLTHFAAPPILMVASPWEWDITFMFTNFGWKAVCGIFIANALYFFLFKKEMAKLEKKFQLELIKKEIKKKYINREFLELELKRVEKHLGHELHAAFDKIREDIKKSILFIGAAKKISTSLLEDSFEQEFEKIKLQQMKISVPGMLPEGTRPQLTDPDWDKREGGVPKWITAVHVLFMVLTIINAHHPALFIPGILFFIGFSHVTWPFQNQVNLKTPMLVGFFLGGLIIHGGLQGWWIAPVLGSLGEIPLMLGATILTAFNDNAAITYLSTLVPGFTDSLKYAVVAGAVTGGGLTVIANAPNPAGQSLLKNYFHNGISPVRLLKYSCLPTIIMGLCFMLLR